MAYTISTQFSSGSAQDHDARVENVIQNASHINPNGEHEIWDNDITEDGKDIKVRDAYKKLFDASVKDYNDRQPQKCRQIKDYYAMVKANSKKHASYEAICAVGNKDHHPDKETMKQILKEYSDGWHKRNPNMVRVGTYWHADEEGVPHIHIIYIPVAHNFHRGMETQTSYNKALKEQGFTGRKAGSDWWNSENQCLEMICREHGLEIEHPEAGKGVQHVETEAYKTRQDILKSAEREAEQIKHDADDIYKATVDQLQKANEEYLAAATAETELTKKVKQAAEDIAWEIECTQTKCCNYLYKVKEQTSALLKCDVENLQNIANDAIQAKAPAPSILKKTTAKKNKPATVTITQDDYDTLTKFANIASTADSLQKSLGRYETAVDEVANAIWDTGNQDDVQGSLRRMEQEMYRSQEEARQARKERDGLQSSFSKAMNARDEQAKRAQEAQDKLDDLERTNKLISMAGENKLQTYLNETRRAKELEDIYKDYKNSIRKDTANGTYYDYYHHQCICFPDPADPENPARDRVVDYRKVLTAYMGECKKYNLTPSKFMAEETKQHVHQRKEQRSHSHKGMER